MHPSDQEAPLWTLVRNLEWESVEKWRKEHHPDLTREGAFGQFVSCIETTVSRKPQGLISVTVSVLARRAFECEVEYFSLQRVANRIYKVVEPPSSRATE
jgi:hypothetical protein